MNLMCLMLAGSLHLTLHTHILCSVSRVVLQFSERSQQKNCYGCASAAVGHCVTLLKALALSSETRSLLVEARLIGELVHHNQRGNNSVTRHNVQDLLCLLTK